MGTPRPEAQFARIVNMETLRTMQEVRDSGLNITDLSKEVGVHPTQLTRARRIGYLPPAHIKSLRESIAKQGRRLIAAAKADEIDLTGMKIAPLAEKMGVTQQALSEFLRYPQLMPVYRRKQLLKLQKQIGERLVKLGKV